MTETNGVFKAVSPDPEQAYRESIEQLREEGMAPDELKFQFQCQQCGLRCCMAPHVDTVRLSPHSFAYARATLPKETLDQLFELKVLMWEIPPHAAPRLRVGGMVCPFLTLHWDETTKEVFQHNLTQIADTAPPAFQVILYYMLHDLTANHTAFVREMKEEEMGVIVHALISLFLAVWEHVTHEYPDLYPDQSEEVQLGYLTDFYTFLREPPDPTSVFQAICGIHVARPQVCRIFPLGRWFRAETTDSHVFTLTNQRVLVQTRVCPPHAFTQGRSQKKKLYYHITLAFWRIIHLSPSSW